MAEVQLPIAGPSNNLANDMQRSINLFPRRAQAEGEKTAVHLVSAPGTDLFCTLPKTRIRGSLVMDGRQFYVAGSSLYEVRSDATVRTWGSIASTWGRVSLASLLDQIIIGDGSGYYLFDPDAGTIEKIIAAPVGRVCISFNQRIFYHERDSGRVYYSALNDAVTMEGFFTAENRPDDLVTMLALEDRIALLGKTSTEFFFDSGDANTPFQRVPGSVVFNGIEFGDTAVRTDNSIIYVGQNDDGARQVFRIAGFNHVIVSTHAVEAFLKIATDITAFSYQEDGHTFYVLNAAEGTQVLDIGEAAWSERAYLNPLNGKLERIRAEFHSYCYGRHLVADYATGQVFDQSTAYYSDNGVPLLRRRVFRGPHADGRNMVMDELYIDMETGIGLDTGQGSDPMGMLRFSTDGGKEWSNEMTCPLGEVGERHTLPRFHRMGAGRHWAFEFGVSDPVPVIIRGATARFRPGRR